MADQLGFDCKVKSSFELDPPEPAAPDQVEPAVELPEEVVQVGVRPVALPVDAVDDARHQALHVLREERHQLALDEVVLGAGRHHQPEKSPSLQSEPTCDNNKENGSDDQVKDESVLEHTLDQLHGDGEMEGSLSKLRLRGFIGSLGKVAVPIPTLEVHHHRFTPFHGCLKPTPSLLKYRIPFR